MEFKEAREYIDNLNKYGSKLGLDNIKALLALLDNPQEKLNVIHVAGTNGKGSTIAFMGSILKEAGYKVGKYTSPVVFEYLEKYQINDENIDEEAFAGLVSKVKKALEQLEKQGIQPTIFEVETAMAFEYFNAKKCDVVILETGMGGDMDATNVCSKVLASVLVSISLDHMGFLGDAIEEIAYHKAGIIKEGCPVIAMKQQENVLEVIRKTAKKQNSIVYEADAVDRKVSLAGEWQKYNAGVAVKVMEVLVNEHSFHITDEHIDKGLSNAKWPGRFERIFDEPCIIIDGAHNPDAAKRLRETIDVEYKDTRFVYIIGVLGDKDFDEVIKTMADRGEYIITITPPNARGLEASILKETVEKYNEGVQAADSIEKAYDIAMEKLEDISGEKAILAFGSLSYLGEFKRICKEKSNDNWE